MAFVDGEGVGDGDGVLVGEDGELVGDEAATVAAVLVFAELLPPLELPI